MTGLTLPILADTHADTIATAAQTWLTLAEDIDNGCEELIRGTRELQDVWPQGTAAEAAWRRAADLRAEASNAYQPCQRIGRALREHADTLRSLQAMLHDITIEATRAGFTVDLADGTVSAPARMFQDSSARHVVGQTVNAYMWQLDQLLARANELDEHTRAVLASNLPDPQRGFGTLTAASVDEATLRGQQGRPPADVNAWWHSLTPQQQEQAIRDYPHLVGWLDGIPATDRDTANRLCLTTGQQGLRDRIAALNQEYDRLLHSDPNATIRLHELAMRRAAAQTELDKLDEIDRALTKLGPNGVLLGADPTGDGRVIIAVGNPDTAAHTGVWVPGLGTTVEGRGMSAGTVDNVERMIALNEAAQPHTAPGTTVSTVYWLGYDAPDLNNLSVTGEQRSHAGAGPYVSFMEGMRATHDGGPGHLVAMGHSYGTTVVGEAALTGRLNVDDIITAGSPGMHANHASQLMADPQHVWAGAAHNDPVADTRSVGHVTTIAGGILGGPGGVLLGQWVGDQYTAGHNISPQHPEFGANQYDVDTSGHSGYWDRGSASLDNQGAILAGDYAAVHLDHGQKPENWK